MQDGNQVVQIEEPLGPIYVTNVGHNGAKAYFVFRIFVTIDIRSVRIREMTIQFRPPATAPMPPTVLTQRT